MTEEQAEYGKEREAGHAKNLDVWNKVKQPPREALKTILGGRLKGKTDINPQWRYRIMTEVFGPCGKGWFYEIRKLWIEDGHNGQKFAFAQIDLNVKDWSHPIPGIGGSMLVVTETAGLHSNDEAFKMAVTDALSVAMKMIGIGADIYSGKWDGTKYAPSETEFIGVPKEFISDEQRIQLEKIMVEKNVDAEKFFAYMGVEATDKILVSDFNKAMVVLKKAKGRKAEAPDDNR